MEVFGQIFNVIYAMLNMEIELFSFRFTFLNLLVYSVVVYSFLRFLFKIFFHREDE